MCMSLTRVAVKRAFPTQTDLLAQREHCSIDPGLLPPARGAVPTQVRVTRGPRDYALFTISELRQENPEAVVRMGPAGRRRLGPDGEFDAVLDFRAPHPTMSDGEAQRRGELVERLDDDPAHSDLIVIAPHGGDIELHTDDQAERVRARLAPRPVSCWRCKGWKDSGAFAAWHIRSIDLNEASFPLLDRVMRRRFTHALAFHGFQEERILIGGGGPDELKQQLQAEIAGAVTGSGIDVDIARREDGNNGDDPANIVNRLTTGGPHGIQIEQSADARTRFWRPIADAVARVYAAVLAA